MQVFGVAKSLEAAQPRGIGLLLLRAEPAQVDAARSQQQELVLPAALDRVAVGEVEDHVIGPARGEQRTPLVGTESHGHLRDLGSWVLVGDQCRDRVVRAACHEGDADARPGGGAASYLFQDAVPEA